MEDETYQCPICNIIEVQFKNQTCDVCKRDIEMQEAVQDVLHFNHIYND